MNLILAVQEFFRPTLKCRRLGHEIVEREYTTIHAVSNVLAKWTAKKSVCQRCGRVTSLVVTDSNETITFYNPNIIEDFPLKK